MKFSQSGQTLLEVLIGLSAAVIVISAISLTTFSSLNNAEYSKNQSSATAYSQQGVEIMRNIRDRNYSFFKSLNGTYCLGKTCSTIDTSGNGDRSQPASYCGVSPCGQNIDTFVRQVLITNGSVSECGVDSNNNPITKVTTTTSWFDNKCTDRTNLYCHAVTISSCLSNYTIKPTL